MSVFAGGVLNTLAVATVIAIHAPTVPLITWLILEVTICTARLIVLLIARRRALMHRQTPTDLNIVLSVAWSGGVGYGVVASLASGDWVVATLACLSAGSMVGGICFRNFSAPRLSATMIVFSMGPALIGALIAGEPLMFIVALQIPLHLTAMTMACFRLNKMLIATMRAEREKDYHARHDPLTGLANRAELVSALRKRLAKPDSHDDTFAVLYLDLDGFKTVNDTHGHAAGDRLLETVAERIRHVLREGDLPARFGGDEFVAMSTVLTADEAAALAQRLIDAIGAKYEIGLGTLINIGVSIGIAMAPERGGEAEDLLAAADAALYVAKSAGGSRCQLASVDASLKMRIQRQADLPPEDDIRPRPLARRRG
ncbi:diguanylate cyclase [Bradyrhizobium sp. 2TAF24]|uniref:diguanylate cyclase n=1 Tax=Bradyrhizobium sp. 2TAF24 TaxID=3233011 RepID=UPI003F938703